jgi:hypothetical protein
MPRDPYQDFLENDGGWGNPWSQDYGEAVQPDFRQPLSSRQEAVLRAMTSQEKGAWNERDQTDNSLYWKGAEGLAAPDIDPVELLAAPGLQSLGRSAARGYMTQSALPGSNKWAYAREIPQIKAWLEEAGNPLTNLWKKAVPQGVEGMGDLAPAMAKEGPGHVAKSLYEEIIPQSMKGHWDVSVPYFAPTHKYAVPLEGSPEGLQQAWRTITAKPESVWPASTMGRHTTVGEWTDTPGVSKFAANVIGVANRDKDNSTVKHEITHQLADRIRGIPFYNVKDAAVQADINEARQLLSPVRSTMARGGERASGPSGEFLDDLLSRLPEKNYDATNYLGTMKSYRDLPLKNLGEEMTARAVPAVAEKGAMTPYNATEEALLNAFRKGVQERYHPGWDQVPAGNYPYQATDIVAQYLRQFPDSRSRYSQAISGPGSLSREEREALEFLAARGESPDAGYLRLKWNPDMEKYLTDVISVKKPFRRQGIADELMDRATKQLGYQPPPEEITPSGLPFWLNRGFNAGINEGS